jgi:hypothetical protein
VSSGDVDNFGENGGTRVRRARSYGADPAAGIGTGQCSGQVRARTGITGEKVHRVLQLGSARPPGSSTGRGHCMELPIGRVSTGDIIVALLGSDQGAVG